MVVELLFVTSPPPKKIGGVSHFSFLLTLSLDCDHVCQPEAGLRKKCRFLICCGLVHKSGWEGNKRKMWLLQVLGQVFQLLYPELGVPEQLTRATQGI